MSEKKESRKGLKSAIEAMNKAYGDGSVNKMKDKEKIVIKKFSSQSFKLDDALGGGYPYGRIVEIYGPEMCIYENTYLQYEVWSKDDKFRKNHKGGTISRLYERFHNISTTKPGHHLADNNSNFYIKSVNDEGCIVRNKVLDVVKCGDKKCLEVITECGESIISTSDHKFMTRDGFKKLGDISVNDEVYLHNSTRKKGRGNYPNRPEVFVKYHPNKPIKIVNKCLYHRISVTQMSYEAYINGMSYDDFRVLLNSGDICSIDKLKFIPSGLHIHHIDDNFKNNKFSNLQLISPKDHGALHAKDRIGNLSFIAVLSKVKLIKPVGVRMTYDLKCAYPNNNYVANSFVVHNSGKTTLCLHAIAEIQKLGKEAAFVDMENSFDPKYAEALGINVDELTFSQPDNGEQALEICDALVKSGDVSLVVVDSVAALVPKSELEGEMGDASVGKQARLMSQAMRKLVGSANRNKCTIIMTNQIRMKIGINWGNPETTPGGNALKYYASQRLDIRRIGQVKEGDEVIANKTKIKVVKNKVASPFKVIETEIVFGKGISILGEILDIAIDNDIVKKSGSWFSYGDTKLGQGRLSVLDLFEDNPELVEDIRKKINLAKSNG